MVPPAPGTFSMMICWPSCVLVRWAMSRAMASVGPPAAKGTIQVSGLAG